MRTLVKRAWESGMVRLGAEKRARRHFGGRRLVLCYHNVVRAPGPGDPSLHLPLRGFEAQMEHVSRTCRVVPLDRILEGEGDGEVPLVSITFDDAYGGAVRNALPVLARLGLPATVFVAPAYLNGSAFWWDLFEWQGQHRDRWRGRALSELQGREVAVRSAAAAAGHEPMALPVERLAASLPELQAAAARGRITVAPHSWSHPNLTRLSQVELEEELRRPLRWLRERFPGVLPVLAYPYGLQDARVVELTRQAGYVAGFRVSGGWIPRAEAAPFTLPRLNVPARLNINGFRLRVSGAHRPS